MWWTRDWAHGAPHAQAAPADKQATALQLSSTFLPAPRCYRTVHRPHWPAAFQAAQLLALGHGWRAAHGGSVVAVPAGVNLAAHFLYTGPGTHYPNQLQAAHPSKGPTDVTLPPQPHVCIETSPLPADPPDMVRRFRNRCPTDSETHLQAVGRSWISRVEWVGWAVKRGE
jgi:hypothetical protein